MGYPMQDFFFYGRIRMNRLEILSRERNIMISITK